MKNLLITVLMNLVSVEHLPGDLGYADMVCEPYKDTHQLWTNFRLRQHRRRLLLGEHTLMIKEVLHADYDETKRIVVEKNNRQLRLSTGDQGIPVHEHMLPMLAAQLQCTVTLYVETPFVLCNTTNCSSLIKVQTAPENKHCSNGALSEP